LIQANDRGQLLERRVHLIPDIPELREWYEWPTMDSPNTGCLDGQWNRTVLGIKNTISLGESRLDIRLN
jgi:hypothetical protein